MRLMEMDRKLLLMSVAIFAISLFIPVFTFEGDHSERWDLGYAELVLGWFPALLGIIGLPQGIFEFVGYIAWFGNPFLVCAWWGILMKLRQIALICSVVAFCFGLLFLTMHTIAIPEGARMQNVKVSFGYFLWMTSMVLCMVAAYHVSISSAKARVHD
jgi:hypothetical protein